ncbi:hypothetical protein [Ornithinibacillus halophilus]|uniref:Uncharacterized protein n=1 Tax=Ornithinibacillus halophilus TaxID=930117 RepID=A0A1M5HL42_9BACI|nr:hypothetical protein [Ornithinibacillus halophilus]SHG16673.1 hypothetical protein SAMN05216225_101829 [Ornithinibacillus halophilus]
MKFKTKVVAGALVVGMAVSGGFAFASVDAGAKLQSWYNAQFNNTVAEDTNEVIAFATEKAGEAETHYNNSKQSAEILINREGRKVTSESKGEVNTALNAHMDSLNDKRAEISSNMEKQFDNLYNAGASALNTIVEEGKGLIDTDYGKFADEKGQSAIDTLNTELDSHGASAKEKLEDKIESAKNSLQTQLDRESRILMSEAKALMNEKLQEVKQYINELKDELVKEQKELIENAGTNKVNEVKGNLDSLVNDIVDGE